MILAEREGFELSVFLCFSMCYEGLVSRSCLSEAKGRSALHGVPSSYARLTALVVRYAGPVDIALSVHASSAARAVEHLASGRELIVGHPTFLSGRASISRALSEEVR